MHQVHGATVATGSIGGRRQANTHSDAIAKRLDTAAIILVSSCMPCVAWLGKLGSVIAKETCRDITFTCVDHVLMHPPGRRTGQCDPLMQMLAMRRGSSCVRRRPAGTGKSTLELNR
jgi:hypothetical protein